MELIFVYNAKKGSFNEAIDFAHKILSPSTYACELCLLTHNYFVKRREWKEFEERIKMEMLFYHFHDFESIFKMKYEYPVILINYENRMEILFDKEQISQMKDVSDLISEIDNVIIAEIAKSRSRDIEKA